MEIFSVKNLSFTYPQMQEKALDNVTPQVEVKSRRVGGATFQVPTEIRPDRKESISMKNLILFARKRGGKSMADKLAAEIMDAFNEQGGAYKRKEWLKLTVHLLILDSNTIKIQSIKNLK